MMDAEWYLMAVKKTSQGWTMEACTLRLVTLNKGKYAKKPTPELKLGFWNGMVLSRIRPRNLPKS